MYISKFIAIYLRSQVSVYRTIGPLVFILMAFSHRIKTQNRIASYSIKECFQEANRNDSSAPLDICFPLKYSLYTVAINLCSKSKLCLLYH